MKIGELARATGLNTRTIRFYEQEGLLPDPCRTPSGYRMYGEKDVERLEFVRKAKRLGLSLEEIRSILHLHDRREATCRHVRFLLDEKLAQLDRVLEDLQKFRAEIVRLRDEAGDVVDCRPTGGRICGIIEGARLEAESRSLAWVDPERGRG
jgi:DNA-binding transcriptional MerR regulator